MSRPQGHWLQWDGRAETREELSRRLTKLYFESPCCCGSNIHPELGIRDLFRHVYHALRCRVGLCIWRSEPL